MKRSILCEKCSAKRLTYTLEDWEPRETTKRVRGSLARAANCDTCGSILSCGDKVICESISTDQNPYFEWESDFLQVARHE